VKVMFTVVGRVERPPNRTVELPVPPREGESLHFGPDGEGDDYEVRTVVWFPDEPDFDVYVVLR